jgi:hypothetical protein
MNFNFSRVRVVRVLRLPFLSGAAIALGVIFLALTPVSPRLVAQKGGEVSGDFKRLVAELSAARLNGGAETEAQQEKPLAFLDSIASSVLSVSPTPDLAAVNQRLAGLVSQTPPVGENYRLVKLGGTPSAYAMVVNFGLGGPAAVRIYIATSGRYTLASRIDHFAQKDFFDSDVELVPVSEAEPVFVTVSGRTDDLSTGLFSAWRFDGLRVVALWSSDLLQQSNYEADASGFHLTYCGQEDEDHPSQCLKMTRDLYRFEAGEWKRVQTADFPSSKPAAK